MSRPGGTCTLTQSQQPSSDPTHHPTLPHQKTAEDLEYSELLDQAAEFPAGSVDRLLRVAAFAVRCAAVLQ